jgi:hypothetical protein
MTARCPSELSLERHLLEPATSPIRQHVAACDRCAVRLEEMRAQGEHFLQFVFPATVAAIEAAARPRSRLGGWLRLGLALAVAAGLVVLVRHAGPPEDGLGSGSGLGLAVLVQEAGTVRAVRDGGAVVAAAELRFRVRTSSDCRLWILALDASGEVSRLYPGEGTGGAAVHGTVEIPAGVVLDGRAGPQRLYAVCTPGPSRWRALAPQLKGAPGSGEALVRARPDVARLPAGTLLASVLVEKRT